MLKIWGRKNSSNVRKVLWCAEELGLDYESVDAGGAFGVVNEPHYRALNPNGLVPMIEDDGLVLNESLAQTLYVARKHGGPIGPRDLTEEAQMLQWSLFAATSIETEALKISMANNEGRLGTEAGDLEAKAVARILARPFGVLEKHFAANDYAVGGRFTVADINLAEIVRYAQAYQPLFDAHPKTAAWLTRIQSRPGFKAMWEKRLAEVE